MRIGIYSPYLDTLTGGEKYIFTIASCLSSEHDVTIFWNYPAILQKASDKFNLDLKRVDISKNIFDKDVSPIKRISESLKYDRIIFLSDGSIPLVASRKLILHFQFPIEWVNTSNLLYKFKKSRVSKIICNSYFTKSFIDKKLNVTSFVLYPPCDLGKYEKDKKENLILTVGRWSMLPNGTDFKKLSFLVDSFKEFQKKRLKGWEFAIVTSVNKSDEDNFSKFEKSISSKFIKIYKNADYNTLQALFQKSKIYWHGAGHNEDIEKHPELVEHFGISTVEAMSYGAVPIVVNLGGQKEIVKSGENGYLWDTKEELVDYSHKVATDDDRRDTFAQKASLTSNNFSVDRFCEELNHLL